MADPTTPTLIIQSVPKAKPLDPAQIQVTAKNCPGIFASEAIRIAIAEAAVARSDQAKCTLVTGNPIPSDATSADAAVTPAPAAA